MQPHKHWNAGALGNIGVPAEGFLHFNDIDGVPAMHPEDLRGDIPREPDNFSARYGLLPRSSQAVGSYSQVRVR
jgi:hypothetical protein